jgi:regulatory protein
MIFLKEERNDTEFEKALQLAEKRYALLKGASRNEIYNKIGGFLARRGFSLDTVKAVIDQILKK